MQPMMSEWELMKEKMATDSHSRDCKEYDRGKNIMKMNKEDAKTYDIHRHLRKEEYEKEVAEIREQFNKLELMIKES